MTDLFKPKDGWESNELKNYFDFISYWFTNPMPESEDWPFMVTALNVNHGKIVYSNCRKTEREDYNLLTSKSKPRINDVLITKDWTLWRVALVDRSDVCINQSVAIIRPNSLVVPLFLKYLLGSPYYQKKILDDAWGSTIKHIYITIIDKMIVYIPKDIKEQEKISSILSSIDSQIETEIAYRDKLQMIKQGMMKDLLSGRVRVKF